MHGLKYDPFLLILIHFPKTHLNLGLIWYLGCNLRTWDTGILVLQNLRCISNLGADGPMPCLCCMHRSIITHRHMQSCKHEGLMDHPDFHPCPQSNPACKLYLVSLSTINICKCKVTHAPFRFHTDPFLFPIRLDIPWIWIYRFATLCYS